MQTYHELLKKGAEILREADIPSYEFDAKLLLMHVYSLTTSQLLAKMNEKTDCCDDFLNLIEKRASHYPLQYILGEWEFWGRDFSVGEGVLIPRADTETLIETALPLVCDTKNPKILDLCSGSGCIAITLALEIKNSEVLAVELSDKAYHYLTTNIKRNCATNVTPILCDACEYEPPHQLNLIVSNPPYIKTNVLTSLQDEVQFEPTMALDGDEDGLFFYRTFVENHAKHLVSGGYFAFEIGFDQADDVTDILQKAEFLNIKVIKDLSGCDRVVIAQKV